MTAPSLSPSGPVVERLGVRLHAAGQGLDPAVLLGLALRRNPLRAQLLVSRVLGKHVPTDPRLVRAAGLLLGALVADALAERPLRPLPVELLRAAVDGEAGAAAVLTEAVEPDGQRNDALVLGFAETATALGHCVAEALTCDYLHSTRRPVPGFSAAGGFAEEHSHATEHLLLPSGPGILRGSRPLVLVDDELSTGRTALNTIRALHAIAPRERYVLAALVDVRDDPGALVTGVAELGARLDVVSLAAASLELPFDVVARADAIRAALPAAGAPSPRCAGAPPAERLLLDWPAGLPVGGRHGFRAADHAVLAAALQELVGPLTAGVADGQRVLVLGTEELMALPLYLACALAGAVPGADVRFSTTTRSPAVVVDEPGYALRSGITFPAHDAPADGPGPRFAYNVAGQVWDHVVVVVDPPADTPALRTGLLAELAPFSRRTVVAVTP